MIKIKRLLFFWFASFILASGGYGLLWLIMPSHYVFGALYRMFLYHWEYPLQYIAIPCFFYGILAALFADTFSKRKLIGQILLTLVISIITVLLSSPLGGMLWHYHDMKAGYFPEDWFNIMITKGFSWGLNTGWVIIALSVPYNILGIIICYFLTRKGAALFKNKIEL